MRTVGPDLHDPRLHVAAVIVSVQVLGQTLLDFDLSIAQILLSIGVCAAIDLAVGVLRDAVLAWPASAMLTGNGVALILRVPGTEHGDWWSLRGAWIFAGISAVSMASKYLVRSRGRHVFNPSNVGLVLGFVVLGVDRADPQELWWAPWSPTLALTLAVIVLGGFVVAGRLQMLSMALNFWVVFAACMAVVSWAGQCMTANWRVGPVCDWDFWWIMVTSPEVFVFLFFMITDPRTTPGASRERAWFGAAVAVVAALLIAPQDTEFGVKVALLGGLTTVSAVLPVFTWARDRWRPLARTGIPAVAPALLAAGVLLLGLVGLTDSSVPADGPIRPDAPPYIERSTGIRNDLPPIEIDGEVGDVAPGFGRGEAEVMVSDLLTALEGISDALGAGDPFAVDEFAARGYLIELRDELEVAAEAGTGIDREYEVESVEVFVHREGDASQAGPRIGLEVRGTVTEGGDTSPLHTVFVLEADGDRYRLAAEYPPVD